MRFIVQFFRNLVAGDLPLVTRVALFARNYRQRFVRREPCCGHPGEPGC